MNQRCKFDPNDVYSHLVASEVHLYKFRTGQEGSDSTNEENDDEYKRYVP
jgi:hypothetical protein